MTYASDSVRFLFHMLPTKQQSDIAEMEENLSKKGQQLAIDAVMQFDGASEVVVRITTNYERGADSGHRFS